MQEEKFIEQVLRTNPDIIYTSPSVRSLDTASEVAKIMELYRDKKVEIISDERLRSGESMDTIGIYQELIEE